jgi:hypothetical protein
MVIENLVYSDRFTKKGNNENLNTYTMSTEYLKECITNRLLDVHLLGANEIWISDHNKQNHTYKYLDWPVVLEESPDTEEVERLCKITAKFGDRKKDKIARYGV